MADFVEPLPPAVWTGEVLAYDDNTDVPQYFLKMFVEGCMVMVATSHDSMMALTTTMHRARKLGDDFDAKETHHMRRGGMLHVQVGDWETIVN